MNEQQRDDSGEFTEKVSTQDVLKVFDAADAPVLTARELADELSLSRSAMNHRLNRLHDKGLVDRKETGSRAVAWWATVAPQLSDEAIAGVEESDRQRERGETVSMAEMKRRLEMDG
jgi:DNA-binding IclR family transcriptional regulator